jgi:hypothetical protein
MLSGDCLAALALRLILVTLYEDANGLHRLQVCGVLSCAVCHY